MIENLEIFGQLLLAAILGSLIGAERKLARKGAGIRTFALVALGACLFSLISILIVRSFPDSKSLDPSRIASQVVVGIGFIGAGVIIFQKATVRGLTTAAGLWVSGAIGMAIAFKFYALAVFTTIVTISILFALWFVEDWIVRTTTTYREESRGGHDNDE